MKNPADYEAGKTSSIINPATGKRCSGGAARNVLLARSGGLAAIETKHFIAGIEYVKPVLDQYKEELAIATTILSSIAKHHPQLLHGIDLEQQDHE